jgi:hypothetical protein
VSGRGFWQRRGSLPAKNPGALERGSSSLRLDGPAPRLVAFLGERGSGMEGSGGVRENGGRTDGRARAAAASAGCDGGGRHHIGGM